MRLLKLYKTKKITGGKKSVSDTPIQKNQLLFSSLYITIRHSLENSAQLKT